MKMINKANVHGQSVVTLKQALEMDIIDYNPSQGFRKIDPNKLKLQGELIKTALDNGENFSNIFAGDTIVALYLESLTAHKDMLLNHPTNPLNINDFLKLTLQGQITEYNQTTNLGETDPSKLKLQGELIKEALDKGADLVKMFSIDYGISKLECLAAHKDIFLNHPTNPLSINDFLKLILQGSITEYNQTESTWQTDPNKLKLQGDLIKEALGKGASICNIIGFEYISAPSQTLATHKDLLLNQFTKDIFLLLVLLSSGEQDGDNTLKYELVEEAITLGANVNFELRAKMGSFSPLTINDDRDIGILLKAHGATCNAQSETAALFIQCENIYDYAKTIGQYAAQISKNLATTKAEVNKIPYLLHHVWLTHPESPREIDPLDIETVLATKHKFEQSDKEWTHIVWTNDRTLIPNSVSKLEKHGIEVRSIESLQFELRLINQVYEQINQKNWGTASDILRYSLVEHFGGVYADLNFDFTRSIEEELYKYDYFAQDFINYFFAAKPKHPIMTELLNLVEINLLTPPPYITSINETELFGKTVYISLLPFSLAYLKASNLGSNVDIVFPPKDDFIVTDAWLSEEVLCPSFWTVMKFPEYLGFCGSQELAIGEDGKNGLHMTWVEG